MSKFELMQGDCLKRMIEIPDDSVDMVLTDPPYGTTACKWDSIIPLEPMWTQLKRVTKKNGVIVIMASQPFTTTLIASNMEMFKYCWVWEKSKGCNFTHAKNMPIKFTEDICVFSSASIGHSVQLGDKRMPYNPQGLVRVDKEWSRPRKYENGHKLKRESHSLSRIIEFGNYPRNILRFPNSDNRERGLHPTQKPVALMEYLIKTYTNEGETVLDFAMGSFTTAIACLNTKRSFIGVEKDEHYFQTGKDRLEKHLLVVDYLPEVVES